MCDLTKCTCIGAYFVDRDFFSSLHILVIKLLLVFLGKRNLLMRALLLFVPFDCVLHSKLQCKAGMQAGALKNGGVGLLGRHYVPTGTENLF